MIIRNLVYRDIIASLANKNFLKNSKYLNGTYSFVYDIWKKKILARIHWRKISYETKNFPSFPIWLSSGVISESTYFYRWHLAVPDSIIVKMDGEPEQLLEVRAKSGVFYKVGSIFYGLWLIDCLLQGNGLYIWQPSTKHYKFRKCILGLWW